MTPTELAQRAACAEPAPDAPLPPRQISIWEITSWILPMAPEHLRRVLAADPTLPQGSAGAEGGTRWFSQADLTPLRSHFAQGPRKARYLPPRPATAKAPLIALTGPLGAMGRSTALLHLATAAALSGYRILVIDGDPAGTLGHALPGPVEDRPTAQGVLSLIARSAARHLRRLNEARLDRGEAPQPMDEVLNAALTLTTADLIRPSRWPGLDVLPAAPALLQADLQIAAWQQASRSWHPGRALAQALDEDGTGQRYDLILCDTPRGLGPLALSLLTSAEVLLAPLPLRDHGLTRMATGLQALADATGQIDAQARQTARALGQATQPGQTWQRLWVLPNRAGPDAARLLAGFAAKLGDAMLPTALPEIAAVAEARVAQFYDLDYRSLGRLAYAPQREACDAAWRGVAEALAALWAETT
ncbi:MAG: AAA family ATPase [bacterium]